VWLSSHVQILLVLRKCGNPKRRISGYQSAQDQAGEGFTGEVGYESRNEVGGNGERVAIP